MGASSHILRRASAVTERARAAISRSAANRAPFLRARGGRAPRSLDFALRSVWPPAGPVCLDAPSLASRLPSRAASAPAPPSPLRARPPQRGRLGRLAAGLAVAQCSLLNHDLRSASAAACAASLARLSATDRRVAFPRMPRNGCLRCARAAFICRSFSAAAYGDSSTGVAPGPRGAASALVGLGARAGHRANQCRRPRRPPSALQRPHGLPMEPVLRRRCCCCCWICSCRRNSWAKGAARGFAGLLRGFAGAAAGAAWLLGLLLGLLLEPPAAGVHRGEAAAGAAATGAATGAAAAEAESRLLLRLPHPTAPPPPPRSLAGECAGGGRKRRLRPHLLDIRGAAHLDRRLFLPAATASTLDARLEAVTTPATCRTA